MDTNLGVIELTEKQISNLNSLNTENIKGFSYWHDKKEVVVVSMKEVDVEELRQAIASLPDEDSQEALDAIAEADKKSLVDAKMKELAISELKKEGKLDFSGKITASGKLSVYGGKL